jgi:MoaA/NifB/PqqE/SkfB family radical SAM enzyme
MCDIWRDLGGAMLAPERIAAEAPQWRRMGVRQVLLSGGEPLLHPRLWQLIAPLRAEGMAISLCSSGQRLAELATELPAYVDELILSLDGPAALHDRIRGLPGAFRQLESGLAALHCHAGPMPIRARCTVQAANHDRLRETVGAARALGLDSISFLAVDTQTEAFNRPGGWPAARRSALLLSAAGIARLEAELAAMEADCAEDFASGFIIESPAKLRRRILGHFRALAGLEPPQPGPCNAPWVSAVIEADGRVRPCFFHPPFGQWDGQALQEILGGPEARRFRRELDVANNPICGNCVCRINLQEGAAAGVV